MKLTINVLYELGRTSQKELERVLAQAAEHLYDNCLLTGGTEASVENWQFSVDSDSPEESATKSSGWFNDRVPFDMRDVMLDTSIEDGELVVGFWDTTEKNWKTTIDHRVITDSVYSWRELSKVDISVGTEIPNWYKLNTEKR